MIMPSAERASNEQTGGRTPNEVHTANCQHALEQMRYRLYLLDLSQRRPSIEDCMAALLEGSGHELPA